jgi:broad specificity phosphatase PhoE
VASLSPAPQLLVASPLRRALRTAELAFADAPPLPRLVSPLCRERLYHSSDVGRAPAIIAAEHPSWGGFDALDPIWWHSNGDGDPLSHDPEPEGARMQRGMRLAVLTRHAVAFACFVRCAEVFLERVSRFRAWLAARPESVIAVVSHWGVIDALTQIEFANCEVSSTALGCIVRPARAPTDAPLRSALDASCWHELS